MNMQVRLTLYDILQVRPDASIAEIKSAFRRLSQQHHPDKNRNSAESTARFKTIHNAYAVLSDPATRQEYDDSLQPRESSFLSTRTSRPGRGSSARLPFSPQPDIATLVLGHLNFIMWEIETLLHSPRELEWRVGSDSLRDYLVMMLTFLDRWVLDSAGYPDYFFEARKMAPAAKIAGSPRLPYSDSPAGHKPYANIEDYFYDVRRRMDRFLSRAKIADLLRPVDGTSIRLIDCIFEAHNYCVHYLAWINRTGRGPTDAVPQFSHSNELFEGNG